MLVLVVLGGGLRHRHPGTHTVMKIADQAWIVALMCLILSILTGTGWLTVLSVAISLYAIYQKMPEG